MSRLKEIYGLRCYLALWVLVGHAMAGAGYDYADLSGIGQILRGGPHRIDLFFIISGFVVFHMLDSEPEPYRVFLLRRFMRLWPVFVVMFLLSLPFSSVRLENALMARHLTSDAELMAYIDKVQGWRENLSTHFALHMVMLHGLVPNVVLFDAPGAFLPAAWAVSLLWQFYLLAPLLFYLATRYSGGLGLYLLCLLCLVLFLLAPSLPKVEYGAALPMHIEFFLLGMLSYLAFRECTRLQLRTTLLPVGIAIGFVVYFTAANKKLVPICLWLMFFALLLDLRTTAPRTPLVWLAWVFNNRLSQWVGKVSYSFYLCHGTILNLVRHYCLVWWPELDGLTLLLCLLVAGLPLSLIASGVLYRIVEKPGINLGQRLAESLKRAQGSQTAGVQRA